MNHSISNMTSETKSPLFEYAFIGSVKNPGEKSTIENTLFSLQSLAMKETWKKRISIMKQQLSNLKTILNELIKLEEEFDEKLNQFKKLLESQSP